MYGVAVSPGLVSNVTDAVIDEIKAFLTIKRTFRAWSLAIEATRGDLPDPLPRLLAPEDPR